MQFRKVQCLRGPNIWANFPVLEAWIDLEELKDSSSDAMPGFNQRLMDWLPTLIEHRCSVGQRGGFFERLRRGTYLAHILEHVALELQTLAGTPVGFGRTRQANSDGVYKIALEYQYEQLGRAAFETARRLCLAAVHDTSFDVERELAALCDLRARIAPGPGLEGVLEACRARQVPIIPIDGRELLQLGYGVHQRRVLAGRVNTAQAVTQALLLDNERSWNLLYAAGFPVPEGRAVHTADEAWQAAEYYGLPAVVRPRHGQEIADIQVDLTEKEQITRAFNQAARQGTPVLLERQAAGARWRLLVIGDHVVDVRPQSAAASPKVVAVDDVNADLKELAVHVARTFDLDVAAVDVVAVDLKTSLEEQGGVVIGVITAPDLDAHISGPDRKGVVGEAIVKQLYPGAENGRIPIVSVTGTNGKTTVTRFIAHLLGQRYQNVGMTCTEGIYVRGRRLSSGDCSGPQSAQVILEHPRVDAAVLETARGGILRAGLGFDRCDVAVVTNVGEGDHLGASEIDTPEQLAWVKSVIVAAVSTEGTAILNAEDPLVVGMAKYCRGSVLYFAKSASEPVLAKHRAAGGLAAFIRDGQVVLAEGSREVRVVTIGRVPLTQGGRIIFHVENTLAATAAAWRLGLALEQIAHGAETFTADLAKDPARFNLLRINGGTVILDYGHNADALLALIRTLNNFPHQRRSILYSSSGDRRDVDLVRQGEILGHGFDSVVLYEDPRYLRGRAVGEIVGHLRAGLAQGGRVRLVQEEQSWEKAAELALESLREHELLVLQADVIDEAVEFVTRYMKSGTAREISMDEALEQSIPQPDQVVCPADEVDIEVRPCPLGHGAYALRPFASGERVYRGWGEPTPFRIRESMQIDVDEHVFPPSPLVYFNHSCDPNCGILIRRGSRELVVDALRPINVNEELTLDYATFESDVEHVSGPCQCGTAACRGRVAGYESLTKKQREAYGIYIAEYLREREPARTRPALKEAAEVLVAAQG